MYHVQRYVSAALLVITCKTTRRVCEFVTMSTSIKSLKVCAHCGQVAVEVCTLLNVFTTELRVNSLVLIIHSSFHESH